MSPTVCDNTVIRWFRNVIFLSAAVKSKQRTSENTGACRSEQQFLNAIRQQMDYINCQFHRFTPTTTDASAASIYFPSVLCLLPLKASMFFFSFRGVSFLSTEIIKQFLRNAFNCWMLKLTLRPARPSWPGKPRLPGAPWGKNTKPELRLWKQDRSHRFSYHSSNRFPRYQIKWGAV